MVIQGAKCLTPGDGRVAGQRDQDHDVSHIHLDHSELALEGPGLKLATEAQAVHDTKAIL